MTKDVGKALIVRNAASYDFGGAERLVVHIAEVMAEYHVASTVVSRHKGVLNYAAQRHTPSIRGWWWNNQNWSGMRLILLPIYLLWQLILTGWYLILLVRTRAGTLQLMSKDDFIAGTLAGRILGCTVLWTDCADLKFIYRNHTTWYKNPIGKIIYGISHLSHAVILVSYNEQRLIEEALGHQTPDNYKVIHMAGRDETVIPYSRPKEDQKAVIFCATSRLVIAKGILELIDAFQRLSQNTDAYRLWLVGNGPDEALCKEHAANNPYITFWGHQDKPLPYLAASDVYMHPTHHEAFSLSLAEAAMLGKPMIASRVGGNPELVTEQNGILFPVKDVDALYSAMKRLGTDLSLRKQMGKQARTDYKRDIDFDVVVQTKLLPLYAH